MEVSLLHTQYGVSSNQSSDQEELKRFVDLLLQEIQLIVDRIEHIEKHLYLTDADLGDLQFGGTDPD